MSEIVKTIIQSGALTIRDVDNGDEPFVYSSGNRGPGYIMIKGLVGQPTVLKFLAKKLAKKLYQELPNPPDFINGNVTGGMVIGWELRNQLSKLYKKKLPYCYLRVARKAGGHNELITGNLNNPLIKPGMEVLIVEELVNYGQTTINATRNYREAGYKVKYTTCILSYGNPEAKIGMTKNNIEMIPLITLQEILKIAKDEKLLDDRLVDQYKDFLKDPVGWQLKRELVIPKESAKIAELNGISMIELLDEDALKKGAPKSKIDGGFVYYKKYNNHPKVWIALDLKNSDANILFAKNLCEKTKDIDLSFGFKVNLDSVLETGISWEISIIKSLGKPLFVDLKMWNGARTMTNIVRQLCKMRVDYINVYSHAGPLFIQKLVDECKGTSTNILVLTVLTHYNNEYTNQIYGCSVEETITRLLKSLNGVDYHGVILPAKYAKLASDKFTVSPGIRLDKTKKNINYQSMVCTPKEAVEFGVKSLVIGSTITKSEDPVKVLNTILSQI